LDFSQRRSHAQHDPRARRRVDIARCRKLDRAGGRRTGDGAACRYEWLLRPLCAESRRREKVSVSVNRPSLPMSGGCSCGMVRYQITSFPLLLYTCNCTDCQTASGSAFALNMPVATSSLRIAKGEPKGWHHPSPMGAEVCSWFCADCGARIYGSRKSRPDSVNIRPGTLDDTQWVTPIAHMVL